MNKRMSQLETEYWGNYRAIPPPRHDLAPGALEACQLCGMRHRSVVLDLGEQPPCDALLSEAQLSEPEARYPLRMVRCHNCGLAQIDYVVPPQVLFYPDYPYRSGITETLVRNLKLTASRIVEQYELAPGSLAIDIGSNDGTLLSGFKERGLRVLGIEATNIAKVAFASGIETIQSFFTESVAQAIRLTHGTPAVVTATNVFAHVADLGEFMRGLGVLLQDGGIFVSESHYLIDILKTVQYDSIYHEHLKFYSLQTLEWLFSSYGFSIIDAKSIPNYGGSIQVVAVKKPRAAMSERCKELFRAELMLDMDVQFDHFRHMALRSRRDLQRILINLRADGKPAPGIGCPGRASTLLNFCGIGPSLMPYIAEQSTSLKLGMYLPGQHIPIVDEQHLFDEQPDWAVLLSWHYAEPIVASLRARGLRSKIIVPLPQVRIV